MGDTDEPASLVTRLLDEIDDLYWDQQEGKPHRGKLVRLTNEFVGLYGKDGPVLRLLTAPGAWSAANWQQTRAAFDAFYDSCAESWIEAGTDPLLAELNLGLLLTMQDRRALQSLAFSVRFMPFRADPARRYQPPAWVRSDLTEHDAYLLLEAARWPAGRPDRCPHCAAAGRFYFLAPRNPDGRLTRTGRPSARRLWTCGTCRRKFSVLTGTVLAGTKLPLRVVLNVTGDAVANCGAVNQADIARRYGITPAASRYLTQLAVTAARADHPLAALTATA